MTELPVGTLFVSITPHGVSSFNETWRIETILDGEEKSYFMKVTVTHMLFALNLSPSLL